jgi:carboxymethylenebutenolidase
MRLDTTWTTLQVADTTTQAFSARPAGTAPLPGVIVVQEIWGVDAHIQDVCVRLAEAGYAVLAPDLFGIGGTPEALTSARIEDAKRFLDTLPVTAWFDAAQRTEPLSKLPEPQRTWMVGTLGLLLTRERPIDRYVASLASAHAALATSGRKVGITGFCMGGGLALRLAALLGERVSAAVPFYGSIGANELLAKVTCPVLGQFAEQDPGINASLPALQQALGSKLTLQQHAGARHAFFNDTRSTYDVNAARGAWASTLGFLAAHLS